MNKKVLIPVVIVILIVLGVGAYYVMKKSHSASSMPAAQTATTQTQTPKMSSTSVTKSLADFFAMTSGSEECTYSSNTNNNQGTVYIGAGKMRGDFQSQVNGNAQGSHMINDGTYVYIWTDGQTKGYKMSVAVMKSFSSQNSPTGSAQAPSQSVNMNQKANYSCNPWSVDQSKFTVPTNVTFTDYSAMMQGVGAAANSGTSAGGSASECSACNQIPAGAARTQCLTALKCQ